MMRANLEATNRGLLLVLGVTGVLLILPSLQAQNLEQTLNSMAAMKALDTDADGTLDLKEARNAATRRFHQLDPDHDGTLDAKEAAKVCISPSDLKKMDPDKDGTLDLKEYLAIVELRFKAADTDHDGTLDAKELATPEGKALLRLLW